MLTGPRSGVSHFWAPASPRWRVAQPAGVSARASSGFAASTSGRRCGGVRPHARTLPRGDATRARGGGDAFDRLVRRRAPSTPPPTAWASTQRSTTSGSRAASARKHTALGSSRWRPATDSTATRPVSPSRSIASSPSSRTRRRAMCWKEPDVLHLPLKHVAAQIVSLRYALPDVDVPKIVESQPGLLLRDVGACAEVVRQLRREFPSVNVAVVETERCSSPPSATFPRGSDAFGTDAREVSPRRRWTSSTRAVSGVATPCSSPRCSSRSRGTPGKRREPG